MAAATLGCDLPGPARVHCYGIVVLSHPGHNPPSLSPRVGQSECRGRRERLERRSPSSSQPCFQFLPTTCLLLSATSHQRHEMIPSIPLDNNAPLSTMVRPNHPRKPICSARPASSTQGRLEPILVRFRHHLPLTTLTSRLPSHHLLHSRLSPASLTPHRKLFGQILRKNARTRTSWWQRW